MVDVPIPEELWMLWIPWRAGEPSAGSWVVADDDIPCCVPFLTFRSHAEAEAAVPWLAEEYDIVCVAVRVK